MEESVSRTEGTKNYSFELMVEVFKFFRDIGMTDKRLREFMAGIRRDRSDYRKAKETSARDEVEAELNELWARVHDYVISQEQEVVVERDRVLAAITEYGLSVLKDGQDEKEKRKSIRLMLRLILNDWADLRAGTMLPPDKILDILNTSGKDIMPPKGDYRNPQEPWRPRKTKTT